MIQRRSVLLAGVIGLVAAAGGFEVSHVLADTSVPAVPAAAAASDAPLPSVVDVSPGALDNMDLHIAQAELRPVVRTVQTTGVVTFNDLRVAQLSPPARGRIQAIEVAVGQKVRAGERLALLDNFDLGETRSHIAAAQAALAQAGAEASTAQAAFRRAVELVRIGGLAQSELERRRAEVAAADAAIRTRQAELLQWQEEAERQMPAGSHDASDSTVASVIQGPASSRAQIIAPFDGIVHAIGAVPGELVDTSRQIFTLADLSTVWVQVDVAERDLGAIRTGQAVAISVDAYPGRSFTGRVAYIPDQIDPHSGTARVRCEVPNPDGALRANMFATASIEVPLGRSGVLVPDSALQDVNGDTVVFTPAGTGHFTWHVVHTGQHTGAFTELLDGLPGKIDVVGDGSFWLKAALMQSTIPGDG
ncbi:MAG: efflux RND transporter periplasmic adaptor subunit [Acetobacteraceae bacterium]|nr:efflux RND transporter periplasmic adaptor subunit [Acetobacteraceae bacterium]